MCNPKLKKLIWILLFIFLSDKELFNIEKTWRTFLVENLLPGQAKTFVLLFCYDQWLQKEKLKQTIKLYYFWCDFPLLTDYSKIFLGLIVLWVLAEAISNLFFSLVPIHYYFINLAIGKYYILVVPLNW